MNTKKEDSLEEQWPGKTMRDIFLILKSDVERLVAEVKAMFDSHLVPHGYVISGVYHLHHSVSYPVHNIPLL